MLCHTALLSAVLSVVLMLFVVTQVWELLNSKGKTKVIEFHLFRTLAYHIYGTTAQSILVQCSSQQEVCYNNIAVRIDI